MVEPKLKIKVKQEIKTLKVSSIKPWKENPRGISDEALAGLRSSLVRYGLLEFLVVNSRNMQLISGHQRLLVLIEDGAEDVPCVMVDLDDMAQQALAVTLNNQQIAGHFTAALLPILEDLRNNMPTEYLDLRLEQLHEEMEQLQIEDSGKTMPDDLPAPPALAITKLGDLWILGDHRLLCGDSTKPEDVTRIMDGKIADLLATDPPYCIDYTGADRPGGGKDWSETFREFEIKDAFQFWFDFMAEGLKVTKQDAAIYFWYASRRYSDVEKVFRAHSLLVHQQIVWVKPCINLTYSIYPWRHEPCFFGWRQGSKPFFRPARKNIGTVWALDFLRSSDPASPENYSDVWELNYEGKSRPTLGMHPTVKPVECFAIPMRVHTKPGDICLEPFCGSGSQVIAAEILKRRCFAIEQEPLFCDVAVRRWEEFTGRRAQKEEVRG